MRCFLYLHLLPLPFNLAELNRAVALRLLSAEEAVGLAKGLQLVPNAMAVQAVGRLIDRCPAGL